MIGKLLLRLRNLMDQFQTWYGGSTTCLTSKDFFVCDLDPRSKVEFQGQTVDFTDT